MNFYYLGSYHSKIFKWSYRWNIDIPAVGSESGPVGEKNVAISISVPVVFDSCTLQSDGY